MENTSNRVDESHRICRNAEDKHNAKNTSEKHTEVHTRRKTQISFRESLNIIATSTSSGNLIVAYHKNFKHLVFALSVVLRFRAKRFFAADCIEARPEEWRREYWIYNWNARNVALKGMIFTIVCAVLLDLVIIVRTTRDISWISAIHRTALRPSLTNRASKHVYSYP